MLGDMSRKRIRKNIFERCLLTDVAPFETPLVWSNWGSFNFVRTLRKTSCSKYLRELLEVFKPTIPYNYYYSKSPSKRRLLSVIHPNSSIQISYLFESFGLMMIRLCQKSSFSLRHPHTIAKYFVYGKGKGTATKYIEELDENKAYASSYFSYLHFSHLHKFFESPGYTALEKKYQYRSHFDISKCFPSIYTHSIDWAIRGKDFAKRRVIEINKDRSFGARFDKFMQCINFNETNGILVGPEFSRIFAEIILQDIDQKIEKSLVNQNYLINDHYCCTRYIDDFYIFYNDPNFLAVFSSILAEELEKYKLYINPGKAETITRPFISSISIKKIHISAYIQDIVARLHKDDPENIISEKEINKVRSIIKENNDENVALTNFFISALTKRLYLLKKLDGQKKVVAIRLFIDLAFYWLHIDTRVSSVYRITKFMMETTKLCANITIADSTKILDKMFHHLSEALSAAEESKLMVESMNLLIAASEFKKNYPLAISRLQKIVDFCRNGYFDKKLEKYRMTYFEIIAILYYVRDYPEYLSVKSDIVKEALLVIDNYSPKSYSESAHLLFDLLSCPFLDNSIKQCISKTALKHLSETVTDLEANEFINGIEKHSWYTNWNPAGDLDILLRKKEFILTY